MQQHVRAEVRASEAQLNGVRLAWREAGEESDRVLLLVHGFPFHSDMWRPQLESPPPGWRLVAPDLRGFGRSTQGGGRISMETYAEDLAALLGHLQIRRAVLCGLSMGGYITFALLRAEPALVRALVLCDTRPEPDSAEARQGRHAMARRVRQEGIGPLVEGMLPRLLSRSSQASVGQQVRDLMEATPPESAVAALVAMAAREDSTPTLRFIDVPTQVIVGAEDAITPPGEARLMTRAIRGALIEVIDDAGHLPNLERPDAFNAVLQRFLQSVP